MRSIATPVAIVLLVGVGAVEASASARQLAESAGPLRLGGAGVALTAAGLIASAAIYLVLGHLAADERGALRAGAITGTLAGLVGGALRAVIISGVVADLVARYAAAGDWFVPAALATFVLVSLVASAVGGAALAWTGRRLSRAARSRPPA
ncbi:MAG TPA: hypothetical protein VI056_11035 [Candidatus Limnocylindria bacterium]